MSPWLGDLFLLHSSQQLPCLGVHCTTLKGLFEPQRPPMAVNLASCNASGTSEIQGHCQVCRAKRKALRLLSESTGANLDSVFLENTFFIYTERQQIRIELVTRPDVHQGLRGKPRDASQDHDREHGRLRQPKQSGMTTRAF